VSILAGLQSPASRPGGFASGSGKNGGNGVLLGRLADAGTVLRAQASLAALTEDVVKTSEIEGETLSIEAVRSSIARRLGVDIGALAPVDRHVEGVVEVVLDATANAAIPFYPGALVRLACL